MKQTMEESKEERVWKYKSKEKNKGRKRKQKKE